MLALQLKPHCVFMTSSGGMKSDSEVGRLEFPARSPRQNLALDNKNDINALVGNSNLVHCRSAFFSAAGTLGFVATRVSMRADTDGSPPAKVDEK